MTRLPEMLDIRDDLQPARETAEHEIDEDIEDILDLLQTYEDREHGDRRGLLDRIDEELLRLEEQAQSDHTRLHLQAARNRIRIYRDTMSESVTDLESSPQSSPPLIRRIKRRFTLRSSTKANRRPSL